MHYNLKTKLTSLILSLVIIVSLLSGCKPIISLDDIPEYTKYAYVEINGGEPFFEDSEITDVAFESYSPLACGNHLGGYQCLINLAFRYYPFT